MAKAARQACGADQCNEAGCLNAEAPKYGKKGDDENAVAHRSAQQRFQRYVEMRNSVERVAGELFRPSGEEPADNKDEDRGEKIQPLGDEKNLQRRKDRLWIHGGLSDLFCGDVAGCSPSRSVYGDGDRVANP